ncbi:MAG: hypothetical protein IJC59_07665 [Lachnospiraceae bacterium]|nr:hypothetical protein [Lachnospiraceae bacterium]
MENNNMKRELFPVVSGVLKIVSYLSLAAAVIVTLFLIFVFFRFLAPGGIWYLLDEMEDQLVSVFVLWSGFIICRYLAGALRSVGQKEKTEHQA